MFLIHRHTAASELARRFSARARWATIGLALGLAACGGSDFAGTPVAQVPPAEAPLVVETLPAVSLPLFSVHVAFPGTAFGSSDASTALALDANWMLVGDDESNALSVYPRSGGAAVAQWDYSKNGPKLAKELDLEASAKIKDALYLIGSHSNKKDGGDAMADRGHLFEVKIEGTGSETRVTYVGKFSDLENQLVAWDRGNAHGLGVDHFGFFSSAAAGITPERVDGFSIEGMVGAPNDSALWLGFRAPLASAGTRTSALIVPLTNYAALIAGTASVAAFGVAIELDLGGRGIRSIDRDDSGNYLIIAGPAGSSSPSIERNFALFGWNGNPSSAPQEFDNDLDALRQASAGSFETIVALDGKVAPGSKVQLLMDNGDTLWSGKSTISKDLPAAEQQFQGVDFQLGAYRVDRQGPLLKVATPADDRVGVPVDARLVLQFDEALKLGAGNLTLRRGDGSAVEVFNAASAGLQLAYNQVTLTPASSLNHLGAYHLTIDGNALTDLKGNAYAGITGADVFNFVSAGQASKLAIGDLLFVGANAEAPDAIAFTFLKDISGGTQVTFSDRDYLLATQFAGISNEGVFRWTADRDIKAGTIVTIQTDTAPLSPIADIGTTLGAPAGIGKEEVIYAMVGTLVSKLADGSAGEITHPGQFLASITLGGLGTGGKSPREIPIELTSAGTAIDFSVSPANQTNAIYVGSFDRSNLASFAARIKLKANWDVSYAPAPGYPLSGGSMFAGK